MDCGAQERETDLSAQAGRRRIFDVLLLVGLRLTYSNRPIFTVLPRTGLIVQIVLLAL